MSRTIKPVRIESLLADVLNVGTWLASVVIATGLVLSLFYERTPFPRGAQVVTAGIGLFILLPILRDAGSVIRYRTANVDGLNIFYREAGMRDAPALLLLHGFPSASHMFRDLIPLLAERFRLVAPDLPGFGQSDMPSRKNFSYTFDNLAQIIDQFCDNVGLPRFGLYIFDYGAPVGLRIALNRPERVTAIISQNGNAYEEGLSAGWNSLREYWQKPTSEGREALRSAFTPSTTLYQYMQGVADASLVSPDGPSLDNYYLARPDAHEVQLDLFLDYANNVALYPKFQTYFRTRKPPLLAVWGRNDPYFVPAGAEAFKRDIPDAEVHLLDTGHFALETHSAEIATTIGAFFERHFESPWEKSHSDPASSKIGGELI